jgi:hypothetical protein
VKKLLLVLGLVVYFIGSCCKDVDTIVDPVNTNIIVPYDTTYGLGAGFRWSVYGPEYDPGPAYWDSAGKVMASNFDETTPECIWIVGVIVGTGCQLNFPITGDYNLIYGSSTDQNEEVFNLFDQSGYRVWLQVEPGNASVDDLIEIVMSKYSHHPSVTGFGVDVEWLESTSPIGRRVTDKEAIRWVNNIKIYNPVYRLFLKHWEVGKMPPTVRDDIVFIDDSQMFNNLSQMVNEFKYWGNYFKPANVGFQYGYPADRAWWDDFVNPPKAIGDDILKHISNAKSLFWVDFTIIEIFPPVKKMNFINEK